MDDFNLNTIQESRAEWCEQIIMIIRPYVLEGFDDIFKNACQISRERKMMNEYLTTFQRMILQIPKWSQTTIENETKRIIEKSHCSYLEVLLSTTYIAQLKILTAIRAGLKSKKIDIDIPSLSDFIHKVYINAGRELYKNVYLFVISTDKYHISPLDIQKNRRKIELIVKEGILETFRKIIPIDKIIKAYLEPTEEEEVSVNIEEKMIYNTPNGEKPDPSAVISGGGEGEGEGDGTKLMNDVSSSAGMYHLETDNAPSFIQQKPLETDIESSMNILLPNAETSSSKSLSFNDMDMVRDTDNQTSYIDAPKTIERLEEISQMRSGGMTSSMSDGDGDGNGDNSDTLNLSDDPHELSLSELCDEEII